MKYFPAWVHERRHLKPEAEIISRIITNALKAGYAIRVWDGEEWATDYTVDRRKIEAECFATDETSFRFREIRSGNDVGFVWLIHGNGYDVIGDYTDNARMSAIIDPAQKWADDNQ